MSLYRGPAAHREGWHDKYPATPPPEICTPPHHFSPAIFLDGHTIVPEYQPR